MNEFFSRLGFGRSSGNFGMRDHLFQEQADARIKQMLNPPLDPTLKNLFWQVNNLESEAVNNIQASEIHVPQAIPQAPDLMLDTAEAVNEIVEPIIGQEGLEAVADAVQTAEKVVEKIEQPAATANRHAFSTLASAAAAAFKATPSKMFLLAMTPLLLYNYNKKSTQVNANIDFKVSKKKLIIIKLESNHNRRRFTLVATPGQNLRYIKGYTPKGYGALFTNFFSMISGIAQVKDSQLPDRTNSTSSLWNYILAPTTVFALPRVYEKRIYSVRIEDLTYNPFLANGPVTTTWEISPSESLRITHLSQQHQSPEFVPAEDEVVQFGPQKAGRKFNINIAIEDPSDGDEYVKPIPLRAISNNQLTEDITIVQKLL